MSFGFFEKFLPLVRKDLVEAAQSKKTYFIRGGAALGLWGGGYLLFYEGRFFSGDFSALRISEYFSVMIGWLFVPIFMSVSLIQIFFSAPALTREKQNDTLALILLSRQSAWGLIIQKWLASLFPVYSLVFLLIPPLGFFYLLGGFSALHLVIILLLLLVVTASWGALGIACSSICRTNVGALALCGFFYSAWIFLLFIGEVTWGKAINPFLILYSIGNEMEFKRFGYVLDASLPFFPRQAGWFGGIILGALIVARLRLRPGVNASSGSWALSAQQKTDSFYTRLDQKLRSQQGLYHRLNLLYSRKKGAEETDSKGLMEKPFYYFALKRRSVETRDHLIRSGFLQAGVVVVAWSVFIVLQLGPAEGFLLCFCVLVLLQVTENFSSLAWYQESGVLDLLRTSAVEPGVVFKAEEAAARCKVWASLPAVFLGVVFSNISTFPIFYHESDRPSLFLIFFGLVALLLVFNSISIRVFGLIPRYVPAFALMFVTSLYLYFLVTSGLDWADQFSNGYSLYNLNDPGLTMRGAMVLIFSLLGWLFYPKRSKIAEAFFRRNPGERPVFMEMRFMRRFSKRIS